MIGLIVDRVAAVVHIPDELIVPPPNYLVSYQNRYVKGIGKEGEGIRLLLDCEKLFGEE